MRAQAPATRGSQSSQVDLALFFFQASHASAVAVALLKRVSELSDAGPQSAKACFTECERERGIDKQFALAIITA